MGNLINFTNHPSENWSSEQRQMALELADAIIDVPFPTVDANATEEEIQILAQQCIGAILEKEPTVVLCQGEFTLAYQVIHTLRKDGIRVVAAASERSVDEMVKDGVTVKTSRFQFVKFRDYI